MADNDETQAIRELLGIMDEHNLDALKVKLGDRVYELVRNSVGPPVMVAPTSAAAAPAAAGRSDNGAQVPGPNVKVVTAPLVGIFYRSPAPGAEAFVEEGQRVSAGDVLCILEAMKLMNEITSDHTGVITRIIPENGQLVSLGEELFWIEP